MNKDDLKQLINGIGAICEMAGIIRDNLMKNGFTREEACAMTSDVIRETFKSNK
jgi:hypothetical protein